MVDWSIFNVIVIKIGCLNGGGQIKPKPGQSSKDLIELLEAAYQENVSTFIHNLLFIASHAQCGTYFDNILLFVLVKMSYWYCLFVKVVSCCKGLWNMWFLYLLINSKAKGDDPFMCLWKPSW